MPDQNHENGVPAEHNILQLEALLRTKMPDSLILEKYTAVEFLPPGENYGSLILKVDAVIKRKGNESKSEELQMIAKVPPKTQQQRDFFDSPFTFGKESFMYDSILPAYKKLERDCGIKEDDIFDVGATFYGSRLNAEFGDVFDDNAAILMENLKPRGYYSGSRFCGLDIHHCRVTVEALARFHALGIAMKTKNPEFFEVLKVRSKCLELNNDEEWAYVTKDMLRCIKEDPVLGEYHDVCVDAMNSAVEEGKWTNVPEEPWSTIIHADFWINNIMFHRNEASGMPDDVKFVDFQNYLFLSPLRELSFALGVLVDHEVSTKYIPELIDLYHETLVSRLEIMGCDVSPYSREKFDERLPKDARFEFSHITIMLKITTKTVDANDPDSTNVQKAVLGNGSDQFYARMRDLVIGYAKRGWF